jgi:tRNA uridine 5-carbamoylmethylation protein Kti12
MMIMDYKRLTIVLGHYGTGKTEIAINYARYIKETGHDVDIVDLDIVNPYFRSREVRRELFDKWGIKVIGADEKYMNADMPALSRDIYSVIQDKEKYAVFDVGGDDAGAIAFGQYHNIISNKDVDVLFIVNVNRPFTKDADSVIKYIKLVENAARISVTHLVNNTHLSYDTSIEDVIKGQKVVEEVSRITGIPVKMTAAKRDITERLIEMGYEVFPIDLYMKAPWNKI